MVATLTSLAVIKLSRKLCLFALWQSATIKEIINNTIEFILLQGVKYAHSKKHICDMFAEAGAFTVFFRIDNKDIDRLSLELSDYSKDICARKYPCGQGGWPRYRVTAKEHLIDVQKLLTAKVKPKK